MIYFIFCHISKELCTRKVVGFMVACKYQVSCSAEMEVFSLKSLLTFLLSSGMKIRVLVTDRSKSVRKMMKEDFPAISHEFDIWYVSYWARDS